MDTFGDWLLVTLEERGWSGAELARRAHVRPGTISRIISGTRQAGPDVVLAIARALGEPPEQTMRRAGLLPPLPAAVEEEREILAILRRLPAAVRRTVLTMIRALAGAEAQPAAGAAGQAAAYQLDDILVPELLQEFSQVPDEWKEAAVQQLAQIRRMAELRPVRLIGEEEEHETERQPAPD